MSGQNSEPCDIDRKINRNPVLNYAAVNRKAVVIFTIAVNRNYTNSSDERGSDFFDIVAWGKLTEYVVKKTLKKGRLGGVGRRLQSRTYKGSNGKKVFVTEVVANSVQFLERKAKVEKSGLFSLKG